MMDPRTVRVSGLSEEELVLLYCQTYLIFSPPLTVKCTLDEQGYASIALDTTLCLPQTSRGSQTTPLWGTRAPLSKSDPMRSTASGS